MADDGDFPINLILDPSKAISGADLFEQKVRSLVSGQVALGAVAESVTKKQADAYNSVKVSIQSTIDVQNSLIHGNQDVAESAKLLEGLARRGIETTREQRATILALVQARAEQKEQLQTIQAAEEREASILREINGPMETYISNVRALNSLFDQGKVSAEQYEAQLLRIESTKASQGAGLGAPGGGGGPGGAAGFLAEGAQALLPAVGAAGAALAAKQGAEEVIHLADAYTELQNRVRQFTESDQELADVTSRLFDISNKTRVDVESTGEAYTRLEVSLKAAGFSSDTTLNTLETLEKAIASSGATAGQTSRTMLEFGEALATGELKGRQFQSILRNMPTLVAELASGLGVTTKQFDVMSKTGELTTNVLVKALQNARGEIENKFSKIVPTVGQEFEVLKNQIEQSIGSLAQGLGPVFAEVIPVIVDVVKAVGPVIADVTKFAEILYKPIFKEFSFIITLSTKALSILEGVLGPVISLLGDIGDVAAKILSPIEDVVDVVKKLLGGLSDVGSWVSDHASSLRSSLNDALTLPGDNSNAFEQIEKSKPIIDAMNAALEKQRQILADAVNFQNIYALGQQIAAAKQIDATIKATTATGQWAEAEARVTKAVQDGTTPAVADLALLAKGQDTGAEAAQSHAKELEKLRDTIDASGKAHRDFGHQQELINELLATGAISADKATEALHRYEEQNRASLDPMGDFIEKAREQITALGQSNDAMVGQKFFYEAINTLKDKGTGITQQEIILAYGLSNALAQATKAHKDDTKAISEGESAAKRAAKQAEEGRKLIEDRIRTLDEETLATRAATQAAKDKFAIEQLIDKAADKGAFNGAPGLLGFFEEKKAIDDLSAAYLRLSLAKSAVAVKKILNDDSVVDARKAVEAFNQREAKNEAQEKKDDARAAKAQKKAADVAAANGDLVASVHEALNKLEKEILNTGELMSKTFSDAFNGLEKFAVDFATKGKGEFKTFGDFAKSEIHDLTESVLADMTRMLLKIAEIELLGAIFSHGAFGAAAGGINSGVASDFGKLGKLLGFDRGAEIDVGGTPGMDQNLFMARVSRGEHISITQPGQNTGGGYGAAPVFAPRIINVVDRRDVLDAMNSPEGHKVMLNFMRLNSNATRAAGRR